MKHLVALLLVLIALCLVAARTDVPPKPLPVQPYNHSTYFIGDAEPVKANVVGNPLDYAAAKIGLDARHVELPRGWEGAYRYGARFPIIDFVSNRPLYMKQWTEDTSDRITKEHKEHGIGAVRYGLSVLRGTDKFSVLMPDVGGESKAFAQELAKSKFTPKYQAILTDLFTAFAAADVLTRAAKANLTKEDLDFFYANPGYFLVPDGKKMVELTGDVSTQFAFIERARRVRYEYIFGAAYILSGAVSDYVAKTKGFGVTDFYASADAANETLDVETQAGLVEISGFGDDHHDKDVALLVDLGGDDVYTNNAGGAASPDCGVAFCIDHSGNDTYSAPKRNYVQGFGFLGVGFLVDLAGDDKYEAEHFCQGAGILGVGALWDAGGDDTYTAQAFNQGAAMFGLGMLLDDNGEDFYDTATLGQGGATTLGLGILSDLAGDDRYYLGVGAHKDALGQPAGYGQGGALSFRNMPWEGKLTAYGGVGMLVDAAGNDRYRSDGWCCQGGSYIMSFGALVDGGGNDHYSCGTGQGSGIHVTNSILIDKSGNDIYEGGFRCGGSGGDRSPGFLIDYSGDDTYISHTSSYGTGCKPFAFSLLIDYKGDDKYICDEPKDKITFNNWDSFGGVWPESDPALWPYAICLDLGGNDEYQVKRRGNNMERQSFGHGIFLDTEWKGGDVIGKVSNPLPPYVYVPVPDSVRASRYYNDIRALMDPDTFVRFQAVGRIATSNADVVPVLADAIRNSSHGQFNRDVMECIHYFLVNGKVGDSEAKALTTLLRARDKEVRIVIADDFGVFKLPVGEDALIAALSDPSAQVRRFAMASLLRLKSTKALTEVRKLAVADKSEDVRRVASRYLCRILDGVDPFPILAKVLATDSSPVVRVAAAEGIGYLGPGKHDAEALALLRGAAKSQDAYLQRAAGKGLAEFGQVEGIGVLIESLTFPSIDAFYNYDYNVPNFVSAYSGYDMPEGERYGQDAWRKWFAANKGKIDIGGNAESFRAYTRLQESLRGASADEQIAKYTDLVAKYPKMGRAKKALAAVLNQEGWRMSALPPGSPGFDSAKAVEYSKRAAELDPSADYYDTLAAAYVANGQIDEAIKLCEEMMKKYPDSPYFAARLAKLKK